MQYVANQIQQPILQLRIRIITIFLIGLVQIYMPFMWKTIEE